MVTKQVLPKGRALAPPLQGTLSLSSAIVKISPTCPVCAGCSLQFGLWIVNFVKCQEFRNCNVEYSAFITYSMQCSVVCRQPVLTALRKACQLPCPQPHSHNKGPAGGTWHTCDDVCTGTSACYCAYADSRCMSTCMWEQVQMKVGAGEGRCRLRWVQVTVGAGEGECS